jgi:hypothetical protein
VLNTPEAKWQVDFSEQFLSRTKQIGELLCAIGQLALLAGIGERCDAATKPNV